MIIENNITAQYRIAPSDLTIEKHKKLFYLNEIKDAYVKAQEALQDLRECFNQNQEIENELYRIEDFLIESDKRLNELFGLKGDYELHHSEED